jgi:DNA-binding NarL/FixJ family response regulator
MDVGVSRTFGPSGRRSPADLAVGRRAPKVALLALDDVSRRRLAGILGRAGLDATGGDDFDAVVIAQPSGTAGSTADAARAVREAHPERTIVLIAPDGDARAVRAGLEAGADAVVTESSAERAFAPALDAAFAGLVSVPAETRGHILRPALSNREKQVLGMVVLGFSNGEIARKLHLAETTVKSHLSSTFRKLGVRSRSEAAALVLDAESGLGLGVLSISDGGNR